MTPIRPEKPEDFEEPRFAGLRRFFNDYVRTGILESLKSASKNDCVWKLLYMGEKIKPEFWIWRRLADIPRESDQCPFV
jgi:hypothetical protein